MGNIIRVSTLCLVLWFAAALPNLLADVYTWTDEKGVKHYSNVAPSAAAGDEVQKGQELPGDLEDENPANAAQPAAPDNSEATEGDTPAKPAEKKADLEKGAEPENSSSGSQPSNQGDAQVGQGDAVEAEKSRVRELAQALSEGSRSRDEMLANEKKRLEQVIQNLQTKPLDQFGSQKNKRRQIGYYQYRLQELLTSPDSYLQYGQVEGTTETADSEQE